MLLYNYVNYAADISQILVNQLMCLNSDINIENEGSFDGQQNMSDEWLLVKCQRELSLGTNVTFQPGAPTSLRGPALKASASD